MRRIWIIVIALPLFLVFLFASAYVFDQVSHRNRVARNVSVGGVAVGNLSEQEATDAVAAYETVLVTTPAEFLLGDQTVVLDPTEIDVSVDESAVVVTAMQRGRTGSIVADFTEWWGSFRSQVEIAIPVSVDDEAIDVINKDHVLATLTDDVPFVMEMVVENGRGYVPSTEHSDPSQEIGVIPVDAAFSPVVRVRYEVEETRVGLPSRPRPNQVFPHQKVFGDRVTRQGRAH